MLLIDRGIEPYLGQPALPGGYFDNDETLEEATLREFHEETGLDARILHLEQLRAYSARNRIHGQSHHCRLPRPQPRYGPSRSAAQTQQRPTGRRYRTHSPATWPSTTRRSSATASNAHGPS